MIYFKSLNGPLVTEGLNLGAGWEYRIRNSEKRKLIANFLILDNGVRIELIPSNVHYLKGSTPSRLYNSRSAFHRGWANDH